MILSEVVFNFSSLLRKVINIIIRKAFNSVPLVKLKLPKFPVTKATQLEYVQSYNRCTKLINLPIAPRVFSSLSDPNAIDGRRQAKYRKIIVVMYFPIALLFPITPSVNHNKSHVSTALL